MPLDEEGTPVHFTDLNVGQEITLYGRTFHLTDADAFTRVSRGGRGVSPVWGF